MAQGKKMLIMRILEILEKYTDESHRLSQKEIVSILKRDFDMIVDRKAVRRNLLELVDNGYHIEYTETVRRRENGEEEVLLTDWYLCRDFTDAELRLLIDSLLFSKHIPYSQCKELVQKIEGLSSRYFSHKVRHIHNLPENQPKNNELFYTIEILDEAIEAGRQVQFEYCDYGTDKKLRPRQNRKGTSKTYTVNPYQMVATNGRYYLIGNFDFYENIGHYRLDRIRHIQLLDTPIKPVEKLPEGRGGLALPSHMAEHIYMFGGKSDVVTFQAKKHILNDIIDWFGKDVRFSHEDEETIRVTVRVNLGAMKFWALQYAPYVTILSPAALREDVKAGLATALEQYQQ